VITVIKEIETLIDQAREEFEKAERSQNLCGMAKKAVYLDALNQAILLMPKSTDKTELSQKLLLTIKRVNALIAEAQKRYDKSEKEKEYHAMAHAQSYMDGLDQAREVMKNRLLDILDDIL
jgi:hypothetical protein